MGTLCSHRSTVGAEKYDATVISKILKRVPHFSILMSLEATLEELKEDAHALGRFYSKDFGALFCGIHYAGEVYLHEPIPERKQRMEEDLEIINDFYKTIPFNELLDDERYAPLFVVNRLLPGVKRKMNLFFEDPTEDTYEHFFLACNAVHTVGYLYRESFDDALKKVRAYPEGDGFRIQLIGITGTEWNY